MTETLLVVFASVLGVLLAIWLVSTVIVAAHNFMAWLVDTFGSHK